MRGEIMHRTIKLRYRFLYLNKKEYLLDLNANKLAFIFPFIYLFTGIKAYEITHEESRHLGYDNPKPSFIFQAAPGIGVLLSVLLRPYIGRFEFVSNTIVIIFLLIIIFIFNIILRIYMSKTAEVKLKMSNDPIILQIKPRLKDILFVTLVSIFSGILVFLTIYLLLFYEQNYLFLIFLFFFIFPISITHFSLYRPGNVEVRYIGSYFKGGQ
ncbi:DUF443 family protein [Macrococcoides canis]|uniref:DUF443 family protein n=1 Tax=Macrococcoides canis TaxID=1855823 RepID=UPI0013E91038|nr:DUF443 family protein [Macrococcus canis]QIH76644.1 DUF443 family protein [Macrococcus canis]